MRFSIGRNVVVVLALAAPLGLALAESPTPPRSPPKKAEKSAPNLGVAQRLVSQAFDKLEAARQANEYDLGGHAEKAKALLEQAKAELRAALEGTSRKR